VDLRSEVPRLVGANLNGSENGKVGGGGGVKGGINVNEGITELGPGMVMYGPGKPAGNPVNIIGIPESMGAAVTDPE
jgi:hypothetical protein